MPTALSFPGVFIEEIPSGVRAITGVPTAIAAFVGRTRTGPVDDPVILNSFGDFARVFGGLDVNSSVSYSVRDFFTNGGGQAVVVRMFHTPATIDADHGDGGFARVAVGTRSTTNDRFFVLKASNPGAWANDLTVSVSVLDPTFALAPATTSPPGPPRANNAQLAEVASLLGFDSDPTTYAENLHSIFNLTITSGGVSETISNLTLSDSPRKISDVLKIGNSESRFTVWDPDDQPDADLSPPDPETRIDVIVGSFDQNNSALFTAADDLLGTDSDPLVVDDYTLIGSDGTKHGIIALDKTDIFNILCIPPDKRNPADLVSWGETDPQVFSDGLGYCVTRRAMLVVDPPLSFKLPEDGSAVLSALAIVGINGTNARNGVMYFPRVLEVDPLKGGKVGTFVSCGTVAGVMSKTDASRGVWKAPAGIDAGIAGTAGSAVNMTDAENGFINPIGINALRTFPIIGSVVWGARTLRGADVVADDYKYLPVRRFALFLEESLFRGLKFAVFEPNDEPLWAQIRLNVGAFLNGLFRQGAFQGRTPRDAYFVKCDNETTTQNDINLGVVNVLVGFAPLKPAEFVIIKIQQIAGQVTT
jgi:phage tail sheath protein FI